MYVLVKFIMYMYIGIFLINFVDIFYKLVVVCSIERENYFRIVVVLDKYRCFFILFFLYEKMVEYIKEKLIFNFKKFCVRLFVEVDNEK